MANIILKDKSGSPVTYDEISHIKVTDDGGAVTTYTDMSILGAYYATYDDSTSKYTIVERWFVSKGAGYAIAISNGDYNIILSAKSLTIGNSYTAEELGV